MSRIVFLTGLLALAAPALAQEAPPQSAEPTGPASQPQATPPSPSSPEPSPAPTSRPATAAEVGSLVAGEFPRRDADGNGSLDGDEFKSWLTELIARGPGQGTMPEGADLDGRIAAAFTQTDADRDNAVSPAEMTALLARGR